MDGPERWAGLMRRIESGDASAADELLPHVYDELHRLAQRAMSRQPPGQTLQTTALVNEAWMRLGAPEAGGYSGREHFLAVAAKAMRSVLVDHARRRGADKRSGGFERVELDDVVGLFEERSSDLLALDSALSELARADAQLARIVELRFFGGMTHPQIARALDVPLRRVERGWATARAWLHARLVPDGGA